MNRILVIKHGALGDMFRAMGAFKAIRDYHAGARIILLTDQKYQSVAERSGYFDEIWIDNRTSWFNLRAVLRVKRYLNGGHFGQPFDRIYDLQASRRTTHYFHYLLNSPKPEWVGKVPGCSHRRPHADGRVHAYKLIQSQLAVAGIQVPDMPDLIWLKADVSQLDIHSRMVCFIPSCSPGNPEKRWSPEKYAALITWLSEQNIQSVLLGAGRDIEMIKSIESNLSSDALYLNLCDKSSFEVIATLARRALCVIGSDTGPMHIAAVCASRCVILKSTQVDPRGLALPVGAGVRVLSVEDLNQLSVKDVIHSVAQLCH